MISIVRMTRTLLRRSKGRRQQSWQRSARTDLYRSSRSSPSMPASTYVAKCFSYFSGSSSCRAQGQQVRRLQSAHHRSRLFVLDRASTWTDHLAQHSRAVLSRPSLHAGTTKD